MKDQLSRQKKISSNDPAKVIVSVTNLFPTRFAFTPHKMRLHGYFTIFPHEIVSYYIETPSYNLPKLDGDLFHLIQPVTFITQKNKFNIFF